MNWNGRNTAEDAWGENQLPFNEWKVDFLIDYIINIHHRYINQAITALEAQLLLFEESNATYSQLTAIRTVVSELAKKLFSHCRHEEEIIFPYIKQIDIALKRSETYGNLFVRTLRKPLHTVEKEHSEISDLLDRLKEYTHDFLIPDSGNVNQHMFHKNLLEFHNNLREHERIENNYLFPRALDIESKLLRSET